MPILVFCRRAVHIWPPPQYDKTFCQKGDVVSVINSCVYFKLIALERKGEATKYQRSRLV
jgi:hypothetical protein